MTKHRQIAGMEEVFLPSHAGGTAFAASGGTVTVVPPAGTRSIFIMSEGGPSYYEVNGTAAGTASSGYVPQDTPAMIFDCDNFQAGAGTLSVSAGSSITTHLQYYT